MNKKVNNLLLFMMFLKTAVDQEKLRWKKIRGNIITKPGVLPGFLAVFTFIKYRVLLPSRRMGKSPVLEHYF